MSVAERGVGGAYVRHPVTGKIYAEGSAEAEKILAGEIHATRARAEMVAADTAKNPPPSPPSPKTGKGEREKPKRKPRRKS